MDSDTPFRFTGLTSDHMWAVALSEKIARVWDTRAGQILGAPMIHDELVDTASFSPDGARVVTVSGRTVRVWDTETGQPLSEPMKHDKRVTSAAFSPDGNRLVSVSHDRTARVWNPRSASTTSIDALMEVVCREMNDAARRISADDQRRATVIAPQRIGQDVCEGLAKP
jgi:WD40 repeat protein